MGDGAGFLDIIFYAMVAAFLVHRLYTVLGRRTGHEPRPGDRLTRQPEMPDANVVELPDRTRETDEEGEPAAEDISEDPVSAGLRQIKAADPGFDKEEVLAGARSAFEMIVHGFATGDTGTLRALLSDDVFDNFSSAIQERLAAGETLETTVIGIKSAEIIEATLDGRTALLTIKFVSEQVNVTRDTEGHVVDGDPNQVTDITDIWTFARNTRSRNPNWSLVETRSSN